jgi:uncharacterized RDD family membrane protein YckC
LTVTDTHVAGNDSHVFGGWPIASLKRRFGALMLDWLLCLLVAGLFERPPQYWPPVILILEYGFFLGLFTQTPGMRVVRIACVSTTDGKRLGVLRALLRGALLAVLVPALLLDRHQRGWHDRVVGSVMVALHPNAARQPAEE